VPRRAVPRFTRLAEEIKVWLVLIGGRPIRIAALLGFENKVTAFVAINSTEALRSITVVLKHAPVCTENLTPDVMVVEAAEERI
jgi:hypothetical protein